TWRCALDPNEEDGDDTRHGCADVNVADTRTPVVTGEEGSRLGDHLPEESIILRVRPADLRYRFHIRGSRSGGLPRTGTTGSTSSSSTARGMTTRAVQARPSWFGASMIEWRSHAERRASATERALTWVSP